MYQIKFNSQYPLDPEKVQVGREVFHVPARSNFVFVRQLRALKGSDASNAHDEEPADDELEFSDDEEERAHKRALDKKCVFLRKTLSVLLILTFCNVFAGEKKLVQAHPHHPVFLPRLLRKCEIKISLRRIHTTRTIAPITTWTSEQDPHVHPLYHTTTLTRTTMGWIPLRRLSLQRALQMQMQLLSASEVMTQR